MRYIKRLHKLLWAVNVALAGVLVLVAVAYVGSEPSVRETTSATVRDAGSTAPDRRPGRRSSGSFPSGFSAP